jgi:hypothetical protein
MSAEVEPRSFTTPDQAAEEWLPAWFVPRMMEGNGGLALYLVTGMALPVERIDRVHRACDGSIWLDVILAMPADATDLKLGLPAVEPEATVNAAHVVAAIVTGRLDPRSAWDAAELHVGTTIRP